MCSSQGAARWRLIESRPRCPALPQVLPMWTSHFGYTLIE